MFSNFIKEKQITQKHLAEKLNITQSAISQWNYSYPKLDLIPKIAEVLNCSIEEVVLALIETKNQSREVV